jgi:hypothetical protein
MNSISRSCAHASESVRVLSGVAPSTLCGPGLKTGARVSRPVWNLESILELNMNRQYSILQLRNTLLVVLVAGVFLPVAAQSQKVKSLTAVEKGHGVLTSPIEEREFSSALVLLRENGTALLALFSDLQLQADGTWSFSEASPQEIDLKITGGAVGGEVTGSGKLFLTEDSKSFKHITIKAQTCSGTEITVTFVADAAKQPDKDRSSP